MNKKIEKGILGKVHIEKIKAHFVCGQFCLFGLDIGWRHYPIEYNGSQYTVDIKANPHLRVVPKLDKKLFEKDTIEVEFDVIGTIYRYTEDKSFFHRHRAQKVYQSNIDMIEVSEDLRLNIKEMSEEEHLCYYPQIIAGLFELYEKDKCREDSVNEKIKAASSWNGVVK